MMKILVLEDDAHTQELLALRLEGMACTPLLATTVAQAKSLLESDHPSLVLLDLELDLEARAKGEFEGNQFLSWLESNSETANIPVIIHSVYVNHPNEAPQAMPSVAGYLPKPFKLEDLRSIVERFRSP